MWNVEGGNHVDAIEKLSHVTGALWHSDASEIICVSHSGVLTKYREAAAEEPQRVNLPSSLGIAISPDNRRVVVAQNIPQIEIFDTTSMERVLTVPINAHRALAVNWHPLGHQFVVACYNGGCHVRNANSGELVRQYDGHPNQVYDAAWSPDGSLLATVGQDTTVRVYNAETAGPVRVLNDHGHKVTCLSWSPDGRRLATGSHDETVRIWDTATWHCAVSLAQPGAVSDLEWDDNGDRLAVCCRNGFVRILDARLELERQATSTSDSPANVEASE